jgi:3-phenylpropionate/trans-cinnamate dioxygenase ferredoxin subunit
MSRHPLGPADLADGGLRGVALADGRLVLVARDGGAFHALDDVCNHAGCLLSQGRIEGGRVVCPCHEAAFDLRTGAVAEPDFCADQRAYRVVVEGAALFLEEP